MSIIDLFVVRKFDDTSRRDNVTLSIKYEPRTMDGFFSCNQESIHIMSRWMDTPEDPKRCLIIHGPTGCGKTLSISVLSKLKGIHTQWITCLQKRTKKELVSIYNNVSSYSDRLLVIDDIEGFSKGESSGISEITTWLTKATNDKIRIVLLINTLNMNKLVDISKYCVFVPLEYPSSDELFKQALYISDTERIEVDDDMLLRVIEMYNNEPRSIFDSLPLLSFVDEKNHDMDMYNIYKYMINPDHSIADKLKKFLIEPCVIPIIFQENYLVWKPPVYDAFRISRSMADGDIYHKHMFTHNNVHNVQLEVYACLSSIFPYHTNHSTSVDVKFGSIWTKQSAMYQKRKYHTQIKTNVKKTVCIESIFFLKDVIIHLLKNNQESELQDIINTYRLSKPTILTFYNIFNQIYPILKKDYNHLINKSKLVFT